ncbi:hypothetical protein BDK51DRAFT_42848, partial [Blyttiomyces helicus]
APTPAPAPSQGLVPEGPEARTHRHLACALRPSHALSPPCHSPAPPPPSAAHPPRLSLPAAPRPHIDPPRAPNLRRRRRELDGHTHGAARSRHRVSDRRVPGPRGMASPARVPRCVRPRLLRILAAGDPGGRLPPYRKSPRHAIRAEEPRPALSPADPVCHPRRVGCQAPFVFAEGGEAVSARCGDLRRGGDPGDRAGGVAGGDVCGRYFRVGMEAGGVDCGRWGRESAVVEVDEWTGSKVGVGLGSDEEGGIGRVLGEECYGGITGGLRDKRRAWRHRNASLLAGFTLPFFLLMTIPYIGSIFHVLAEVASTSLLVEVFDERDLLASARGAPATDQQEPADPASIVDAESNEKAA